MVPKILIVDDDVELGRTLSDTLEGKGHTPLAVLTGKEGVAAIKEEDISLALIAEKSTLTKMFEIIAAAIVIMDMDGDNSPGQ